MELLRLRLSAFENDPVRFKLFAEGPGIGEGGVESILPFVDSVDSVDRRITVLKALEAGSFRSDDFKGDGEQDWAVRAGLLTTDHSGFAPNLRATIGQQLFQALFPANKDAREILQRGLALAEAQRTQLHLQIQIEANTVERARLSDYPWELLHDGRGFLAQHQVCFSRYIAYKAAPPNLPPVKQVNVLLVSSAAFDPEQNLLRLSKQEQQAVRSGLERAQQEGHIRLVEPEYATLDALRAYLTEYRADEAPHVVHFDGHGLVGKRCNRILDNNEPCRTMHRGISAPVCRRCSAPLPAPQGYLLFEDMMGGVDYVSAEELGSLLHQASFSDGADRQRGVALVVLSACQSALALGGNSVFNGVAQSLIGHQVPAVVAMQFSVTVPGARDFAEQFYRALGQRDPLALAVNQGREAMGAEGNQWYRPVLYLRWQDNEGGQLFAKPLKSIVDQSWLQGHLQSIKIKFVNQMHESNTAQAQRHYIELLVRARAKSEEQKQFNIKSQEGPLSQFINRPGARLLVFGEGGGGKTTSLLKLAADRADRAVQDSQQPIPIYVKLTFFTSNNGYLDGLLKMAGETNGLDEDKMKDLWLQTQRPLLFLLDGFNEVGPDYQEGCITALQQLMQREPHRYVVTSRSTIQGEKLVMDISGISELDVVQLRADQMQDFLRSYDAVDLYDQMDEILREIIKNPFMLWALIQVLSSEGKNLSLRNTGQLYQEFVDTYIFTEREPQKNPSPTRYEYTRVKKPILARFALTMTEEKVFQRREDEVRQHLRDCLTGVRNKNKGLVEIKPHKFMPSRGNAQDFLDEVVDNDIIQRVGDAVQFMHQSVQEYFAAICLNDMGFDHPEMQAFLRNISLDKTDDLWDETILLLAGLTPDLDRLVEELIRQEPFLAARCVSVQPDVLKSNTTNRLIETLASLDSIYFSRSTKFISNTLYRKAISAYEQTLPLARKDSAEWAHMLNKLGLAYSSLLTGNRDINLKRAIACYQEALRFRTVEDTPYEYAATQSSLGDALANLPTGDRRANLNQAIICYQEAFRVYTPENTLSEYAATQSSLGDAYANLPTGDRRANLNQAIACYQEALRFRTVEYVPLVYAATQSSLGDAYANLPTGDRRANLNQAIACYQEALRFRTVEDTPYEYAATQNSLGDALANLPTGDRAANLEQAIACYQEAFRVYTPENTPSEYAATQSSLGDALANLPTGDRAANLEQAIACYQEALRFRTVEDAPYEYAATQSSLGDALANLLTGDRAVNLEQAFTCYHNALRIYNPENAPFECRRASRNLANLHFGSGKWHAALEAYRHALDAGEGLYRSGLSTESKSSEVAENAVLYRNAAFLTAKLGDATQALLILEQGKTRLLSEALHLQVDRPAGVPDEVWITFEQAGAAVRAALPEAAIVYGPERDLVKAYEARMQATRYANVALDTAIELVRGYAPYFLQRLNLSAIQSLLSESCTALVAFCITGQGSIGFVLSDQNVGGVREVDIPNFTEADLNRLLYGFERGDVSHFPQIASQRLIYEIDSQMSTTNGWLSSCLQISNLGPKDRDFAEQQTTMEQVLTEVGTQLLVPILATLRPEITKLIFLPSSGLSLLPLHAVPLPFTNSERVCDRYEVSYMPSLEVLANILPKKSMSHGYDLYAVIDSQDDQHLAFTRAEGAAIASLFAEHEVHEGRSATREAVIKGVRGRAYIHFSGHSSYDWHEPSKSGLALADGDVLSLTDLQRGTINLSAARLVTLSASQTAVADVLKSNPDEYIGLPAGFILAGAPCVIGTLWDVPDPSTALLMERFYRYHLVESMSIAGAIRAAQRWVRDVTAEEVSIYAEQVYQQTENSYKVRALQFRNYYRHRAKQNSTGRPFAHPYYWAAFAVYGV